MPTLTTHEAKAFYDNFGAKQDGQAFYEASALRQLVAHSSLGSIHEMFEFGCGTGRFALDLLQQHLPASCVYRGTDISSTMIELARTRLASFGERASVTLSSGGFDKIARSDCGQRSWPERSGGHGPWVGRAYPARALRSPNPASTANPVFRYTANASQHQ